MGQSKPFETTTKNEDVRRYVIDMLKSLADVADGADLTDLGDDLRRAALRNGDGLQVVVTGRSTGQSA